MKYKIKAKKQYVDISGHADNDYRLHVIVDINGQEGFIDMPCDEDGYYKKPVHDLANKIVKALRSIK